MGVSTKISPEFTIDIPKEFRGTEGWQPGQELIFVPRSNGFVLVPLPNRAELFGSARGANTEDYRDRTDRY